MRVATDLRPRLVGRVPLGALREPLLRNGLALSLSAVVSSGVGFAFWLLATHRYPPAVVGEDSVAIAALQLVGGVAQLNLTSGMIRFLPTSGGHRRRFIASAYALSTIIALVLGAGFVLLAPSLAAGLRQALDSPAVDAVWLAATAAWAIFALEDGALTGLRHARWVPIENAGHGLMKAALVVPLAFVAPTAGILLAWGGATIATIAVTNVFVFRRAVPAEDRRAPEGRLDLGELRRYLTYDYFASLCWLCCTNLLPLFIIRRAGAATSAFFSLAWVVTYVLYLVSISLGSSLVVEAAAEPVDLGRRCRRALRQLLWLVVPAAATVVAGAPVILRLFGSAYAAAGVTTLRLLAVSAVPFTVVAITMAALRVLQRTRLVFALNAAYLVAVGATTWFGLPRFGILAAGIAWLGAQCAVASAVVAAIGLGNAAVRRRIGAAVATCALAGARVLAASHARPQRRRRGPHEPERAVTADLLADLAVVAPAAAAAVARVDVISGGSDLLVLAPRDALGEVLAVVKVPGSAPACADLQRQQEVLAAVSADHRLGAWRDLVPGHRLIHGEHIPLFSIETPMPGMSGLTLAERDRRLVAELTREAIATVGILHQRSACPVRLDTAGARALVVPMLGELRRSHPTGRVPAHQVHALDLLEERLVGALEGQEVLLSWVHGDFSPENVLFSPPPHRVVAVVDWGQGTDAGVSALDVLSWVCAAERLGRRSELGTVLRRLMQEPGWPREGLLAPAAAAVEESGLTHRDLVLLYWLTHVSTNLAKCASRYARNPMWWVGNIESMLHCVVSLP